MNTLIGKMNDQKSFGLSEASSLQKTQLTEKVSEFLHSKYNESVKNSLSNQEIFLFSYFLNQNFFKEIFYLIYSAIQLNILPHPSEQSNIYLESEVFDIPDKLPFIIVSSQNFENQQEEMKAIQKENEEMKAIVDELQSQINADQDKISKEKEKNKELNKKVLLMREDLQRQIESQEEQRSYDSSGSFPQEDDSFPLINREHSYSAASSLQTNNEMNEKIMQLENQIQDLQSKQQFLEKDNSNLKQENMKQSKYVAFLTTQNDNLTRKNQEQSRVLNAIESPLHPRSSSDVNITKLSSSDVSDGNDSFDYKSQLDSMKKSNSLLIQERDSLKEEVDKLKTQMQEQSANEEPNSSLKSEYEVLLRKTNQQENEISSLKQQQKSASYSYDALLKKYKNLEAENMSTLQLKSSISSLEKERNKWKKDYLSIRQEMNNFFIQTQSYNKYHSSPDSKSDVDHVSFDVLLKKWKQIEEENNSFRKLKNEKHQLNPDFDSVFQENIRLRQGNEQQADHIENLKNDLSSLAIKQNELVALNQRLQSDLNNQENSYQQDIIKLKQEKNILEAENRNLLFKQSNKKQQSKSVKKDNDILFSTFKNPYQFQRDNSPQKKKKSISKQNSSLQTHFKNITEVNKSLETRIAKLKSLLASLQKENHTLKAKLKSTTAAFKRSSSKSKDIYERYLEISKLKKVNPILSKDVADLQNMNNTLQRENENLRFLVHQAPRLKLKFERQYSPSQGYSSSRGDGQHPNDYHN